MLLFDALKVFPKRKLFYFINEIELIILFISLQKKDMMDTVKNRRTIRKYQQKRYYAGFVK